MPQDLNGTEGSNGALTDDDFDWLDADLLGEDDDDSNEAVDEEDAETGDDDADDDAESDEDEDDVEGDDDDTDEDEATPLDLHTIVWKGKSRTVTTDELIALAQQGEDYTQKTQAIAGDAKAITAWNDLQRALASDPDAALAALRQSAGISESALQDMDPIERELYELKQWRADQERSQTQTAVLAELDAVKRQFNLPDLDEDALLGYAVEHGLRDLTTAHKLMAYEQSEADKVAAAAEAQKQAKVAAKRSAPKVVSGRTRSAKARSKGGSSDLSIEDALAETLRELGQR